MELVGKIFSNSLSSRKTLYFVVISEKKNKAKALQVPAVCKRINRGNTFSCTPSWERAEYLLGNHTENDKYILFNVGYDEEEERTFLEKDGKICLECEEEDEPDYYTL